MNIENFIKERDQLEIAKQEINEKLFANEEEVFVFLVENEMSEYFSINWKKLRTSVYGRPTKLRK